MHVHIWREGVNVTEPGSFQWCLVRGPETMGTNWNKRDSLNTSKCFFTVRVNTSRGCPERCSLPPWRDSKAIWTWPWATAVGDHAWAGELTRWPPEVPSNLSHSVVLWKLRHAMPCIAFSLHMLLAGKNMYTGKAKHHARGVGKQRQKTIPNVKKLKGRSVFSNE